MTYDYETTRHAQSDVSLVLIVYVARNFTLYSLLYCSSRIEIKPRIVLYFFPGKGEDE